MKKIVLFICIVIFASCDNDQSYDLVIHNAVIYPVLPMDTIYSSIGLIDDRIVAIGSDNEILSASSENTTTIDAKGNFVMPGFIEGHGHFSGLGKSLINVNLLNTSSWEEVLEKVKTKVDEAKPGDWIEGRGWHQEKWTSIPEDSHHGYPSHRSLSDLSSKNPIVLYHASGHSLFANEVAMKIAKVSKETRDPDGGLIVRDENGEALGVFEENAMDIVRKAQMFNEMRISPLKRAEKWHEAIGLAQEECIQNGITSFQDAGSSFLDVARYKELAEEGKLDLRLWVMLRHSHEVMKDSIRKAKIIGAGDGFFTCNAIKTEVDGALGSYGAWLLDDYEDNPGFYGQNTTTIEEVDRIIKLSKEYDMQVCVHAIGDRANQEVLNLFEQNGASEESDLRWRIEHAQHLHPDDISRFKTLGVIASMQGVHCTSDSPFVEKRLGEKRAREGAYVWKSLMNAGALVLNGTDAPVEDVNPIRSFYASVTRTREDSQTPFFPNEKMSRKEAVASYTLNNAIAAYEENEKGSLEIGKYGDIVILSKNLLDCSDQEILDTRVLMTIVGGKIKYSTMN